jgi:hypothetical protein
MAAVLKTAMGRESHRGFESHTLRSGSPTELGSGWPSGGLVVAVRVEGELAEQLAGGGIDDAMSRSWMSMMTWVRASARPTPMW